MRLSYLFNKTTSKEPEDVVPGAAVVKRVSLHKVKATFFFFFFFFFVRAVKIVSSHLIGKIIKLFRSFRVSTSKKKNDDHQVKESSAIRSIQIIYETNLISLLRGSTMSNALNFCFFYVFYFNPKEKKIILEELQIAKKGNT